MFRHVRKRLLPQNGTLKRNHSCGGYRTCLYYLEVRFMRELSKSKWKRNITNKCSAKRFNIVMNFVFYVFKPNKTFYKNVFNDNSRK